jgi:hypothetical protein
VNNNCTTAPAPQLEMSTSYVFESNWILARGKWTCHGDAAFFVFVLFAFMVAHSAHADSFSGVTYDGQKDELVITMRYRGTNPDHIFSLRWGQCEKAAGSRLHEIVVEVLDGQWQDEESTDYTKTTRFGLTDLSCRPAALTLRTAPRFFYTLFIPAADVRGP